MSTRAMSGASGPSPVATAPIAVATVPPERSSDATRSSVSGTATAIWRARRSCIANTTTGTPTATDDRQPERDLRTAEAEADARRRP